MNQLQQDITLLKNENFLDVLYSHVKKIPCISNFTLLGDFGVEIEPQTEENTEKNYFEIFGRFDSLQDRMDFLFNDVTRTKIQEKSKAEFQYRTLFLAKVAHEFKNPLISITELTEKIHESFSNLCLEQRFSTQNSADVKNIKDTLSHIKSMSDFLTILVKDLDYFSQKQLGNNLQIENSEVNIQDLLSFCTNITSSLLKKNNKDNHVRFRISCTVPAGMTFISDELRLKQVLVNLLSNAVKFTMTGEICLCVDIENRAEGMVIQFMVKDTGKGIKEDCLQDIFKPYRKSTGTDNVLGSGLGLSIVSEITSKLGEKVQLTSETGKGSAFWFAIPYLPKKTHSRVTSSASTIKIEAYYKNDILLEMKDMDESASHSEEIQQPEVSSPRNQMLQLYFQEYSTIDVLTRAALCSNDCINIIYVDDETLTRNSSIRGISKVANEHKMKINVISAEDGIECLYIIFLCIKKGIHISIIFSDENMIFLKGSKCSVILKEILSSMQIQPIPFYLVTAYYNLNLFQRKSNEGNFYFEQSIKEVLNKPLSKEVIHEIIKKLNNR